MRKGDPHRWIRVSTGGGEALTGGWDALTDGWVALTGGWETHKRWLSSSYR